jgi:acyl carrier protein
MHQKILALLQSIQPGADFAASADFLEDGLIDSMDVIMITTGLEEAFGVSIPGNWITPDNYASVASLADLVTRCQAARG